MNGYPYEKLILRLNEKDHDGINEYHINMVKVPIYNVDQLIKYRDEFYYIWLIENFEGEKTVILSVNKMILHNLDKQDEL